MNKILLITLVATLFAGTVSSQEVTVTSKLDSHSILIGDQVGMEITFKGPASAKVFWPFIPDTILGNITVVGRRQVDSLLSPDQKTITLTQKFTLTCFDTGFYTIPGVVVTYRIPPDSQRLETGTPLMMLMVKTLPVDTTKAIKPIKGPMKVPVSFREMLPWILLALGVAALVAVVIWYIRKRRKNQPIFSLKPRITLKPWEKALQELEKLKVRHLWQQGQVKEYYSQLTDILRTYIEEQYKVPAMESTTPEILESLEQISRPVPAGTKEELAALLMQADLVKFAKSIPAPSDNEISMDKALEFVNQTIIKEEQPS